MTALDHSIQKILATGRGSRNATVYGEARWLFELAAGGQYEFEDVRESVRDAARGIGLEPHQIRATLKSAERDGRKNPKQGRRQRHADLEPMPVLEPEPPTYPSHAVTEAVWGATHGVFLHDDPMRWLVSRGIDLERLSGTGLCRYLPKGAEFPDELIDQLRAAMSRVCVDGDWQYAPKHGFRLVFRLYDTIGDTRSLSLRCIVDHGDALETKAVPLKPQKRGLVLANHSGVAALRRDPSRRELWADRPVEYVIVEGEPDLLTAACEDTGDDRVRVVFGITGSGSWTDAHAICIPQDAHVIIATDDDDMGRKYAAQIKDTLQGRRVSRWQPFIEGQDVNDAGGLAGGSLS